MTFSREAWFHSADWPAEAVLYQVDARLFGGRFLVNMATLSQERDGDEDMILRPEHSGRLSDVTRALDSIADLGCNTLWIMPPFLRGEQKRKGAGSPYAVRDYARLQPELGTDEDLRALVTAAHRRSLKVIVGFVPNHVAADSVMLAHHRPEDPWFYHHAGDPYHLFHDDDWSDTVKLNYRNPRLRAFLVQTLATVLERYNLDGLRCDMAALPCRPNSRPDVVGSGYPPFWREALHEVRDIIPRRLLFLAEVYGAPEEQALLADGFDAVYHKEVFDVQQARLRGTGGLVEGLQPGLWQSVGELGDGRGGLHFAENHDDSRAVQLFGGLAQARLVAGLSHLLPGVSMVHAGQEYGSGIKPSITEVSEPAEPVPGVGLAQVLGLIVPPKAHRQTTYRFFRWLHGLTREHDALRRGVLRPLAAQLLRDGCPDPDAALDDAVVAFLRLLPASGEAFLVTLNYDAQQERWGAVHGGWPDAAGRRASLGELLGEAGLQGPFSVEELGAGETLGTRHPEAPLIVGLKPLQLQVLRLRAAHPTT